MSIVINTDIPNFRFDVNSVSERASTKLIHQTVSISGQSGSDGYSGADGTSGVSGSSGAFNGQNGYCGGDGANGFNGGSGQPGTNSQHALIQLNGTVENLHTQLRTFHTLYTSPDGSAGINWNSTHPANVTNYNFQLAASKGIVLVQAVGGNGGNGGRGGRGGAGGHGGDGASGYDGAHGCNAHGEGETGGHGGNGGDGGNGGHGGNGGEGGHGGNGGNAGGGGHVQIQSIDPRLFMLIDLDCRAGTPGTGGRGGAGGKAGPGGSGGFGGSGGHGGHGGPGGSHGPSGMSGCSGHSGSSGSAGRDGFSGHDGSVASPGSIQYSLVDSNGYVLETGPDKYHVSVSGYTITDENNDGIYEPDSDFFITNVKWINNGAMTLPYGSILSFPSTTHISNDLNDVSILPTAYINQTSIDSHQFKCHMNAATTLPMNQPYIKSVKITSEVHLLNRLFSGSQVSTNLTCQYPIQITHIKIPTFLGPNERTIVTITFKNISTRSYGTCPNSAGSIEIIFSTHSLIKIVPLNGETYQIINDGRAHYKIDKEISLKSTNSINFEIVLDSNSIHQLYEHLFWKIDLLLRDVLIEKHKNDIRVVPTFSPNIHTDVLLVTNSKVGRAEYLAYQNLFQLFKYSSQTWDIERYGAFHSPEIKWLNTTELIIFIYSHSESTFNTIKSQLFLQHMKSSENAGFISIGPGLPDEMDFALFDYNNLQFINIKQKTKAEATNHLWSSFGCGRPNDEQIKVKANKFRTDFEKQDDHRFLYQVVYDDTIHTDSARCMTVIYGAKYVYKSTLNSEVGNRLVMVRSSNPLLTSSNLPFTHQPHSNTNQQSGNVPARQHNIEIDETNNNSQTQRIIQKEIDLNSQFGRLLCAILFYKGFEKVHMIISENSELASCLFTTGSHVLNFNQILASLAMSIIERDYDRQNLEFELSNRLVIQIANIVGKENNTNNERGVDKNDWFYLLIQSLYEYIDSKFWSSFPWCGCTIKAKQRHQLQKILNDLLSLITNDIPKNKAIYREVQILRLQKLANLNFPAADKRQMCVRPMNEIRAWQQEQNIDRMPLSAAVALEKY